MRLALRTFAILIAIAGVIDPALARKTSAPLAVGVRLPAASHPDFAPADAERQALLEDLPEGIEVNGPQEPQALVVIGDAELEAPSKVPVVVLPVHTEEPGITIQQLEAPRWSPPGRAVRINARLHASRMSGRNTNVSLRLGNAPVASVQHRWASDDERFDPEFVIAAPPAGAHRLRLVVQTDGDSEAVVADQVVSIRDQPLRVLVFDARPTWPVTFARRALEADAMFEVAATTRSSRPVATIAGGAPARLDDVNVDRYDVILVGALDELRTSDLRALDRFVSERGGTLVLAPDRRIPTEVARQFGLPETREVLLERPIAADPAVAPIRGSELLLLPSSERVTTIAAVPQSGGARPVVGAYQRGEGQIVLSGLLDAWRFRGDDDGAFDTFWRSVIADAALSARPRLDLRITPAIARPGDSVHIAFELRRSELAERGGTVTVGEVAAVLTGANGTDEIVRLWPGRSAGHFNARIQAPAPGAYTIRATRGNSSVEAPLVVAGDVVQVHTDEGAALRHAAVVSGGAVVSTPADAREALSNLQSNTIEREVRPMRSPWWIVPFAGLLCAEWALRRRAGLK
jgi:hypothetical protein